MTFKVRIQSIVDTITMPIWNGRFIYKTRILPIFRTHYNCYFYDWYRETYNIGWFIRDRKGNMIPWVHFNKNSLMCLYEDMIIKVEE